MGLDRMLRNRLGEEKGLQHFLSNRGKNEGRKEISLSTWFLVRLLLESISQHASCQTSVRLEAF